MSIFWQATTSFYSLQSARASEILISYQQTLYDIRYERYSSYRKQSNSCRSERLPVSHTLSLYRSANSRFPKTHFSVISGWRKSEPSALSLKRTFWDFKGGWCCPCFIGPVFTPSDPPTCVVKRKWV